MGEGHEGWSTAAPTSLGGAPCADPTSFFLLLTFQSGWPEGSPEDSEKGDLGSKPGKTGEPQSSREGVCFLCAFMFFQIDGYGWTTVEYP